MDFEFEILRFVIAFCAGYFLSLSGSLTQLVTQNQIAAPSTLGFDGLVVLIILIVQLLLTQFQLDYSLEWCSFILFSFLFLSLSIIILLKPKQFHIEQSLGDMKKVILIGIGFNLFIGAIFAVVQFLFMAFNFEFPTGLWFGSFRFTSFPIAVLFFSAFIICLFIVGALAKSLRLIGIGRDFALGLGVEVHKTQNYSLLLSLILTGFVISFFGVFSFLGLILPHLLRSFSYFRKNMKNELTWGAILSGLFLSCIDYLCYHYTIHGIELPVGMVSSVLGSFMMIFLLFRGRLFE